MERERVMRKTLIAVLTLGFAAAVAVSPAQAGKKGFGVGLGVGLVVGGIIASQHHHNYRERRYERPRPVAKRPQPAAPVIRTSDDQGRFYDTASKTWFDGKGQCYKGSNGWSFRNAGWYYGGAAWAEKDGVWQAKTGPAPEIAECADVPAIAARLPKAPTERTGGARPTADDNALATPPSEQATDKVPNVSNVVDGGLTKAGLRAGGTSTN